MDFLLQDSPYHHPVLNINDEVKSAKVNNIVKDFKLENFKLEKLRKLFLEQMLLGLSSNPSKNGFQMENTFVSCFPDGTEEGDFLSLDLGGSNFRVILSRLKPGQEGQFVVNHYDVPKELRKGDVNKLLDFIVVCIANFTKEHLPNKKEVLPLGFTFSFPTSQRALDSGILLSWAISIDCPNAIGKDIVQLLRDAIKRHGNLNIDVVAILNDTTGTLVNGIYLDKESVIGVIIGSGGNFAYIEKVENIKKLDENLRNKFDKMIINTECGTFGDDGSIDFAKTRFDKKTDEGSLYPNSLSFEKAFGGSFIGETLRFVLLELIQENLLFQGRLTNQITTTDSVSAIDISMFESLDGHWDQLSIDKFFKKLGYDNFEDDDVKIIKYVCALISVRNALLLSCTLTTILERTDNPSVTIAVDGSLYKYHPKMHKLMTDFISQMIPGKKFKIILAEDGSGKGGGLVAAVAMKMKNRKI